MMYERQTNTRERTAAAALILLGYVFLAYCLYHYLDILVLVIAAEFILVAVSSYYHAGITESYLTCDILVCNRPDGYLVGGDRRYLSISAGMKYRHGMMRGS